MYERIFVEKDSDMVCRASGFVVEEYQISFFESVERGFGFAGFFHILGASRQLYAVHFLIYDGVPRFALLMVASGSVRTRLLPPLL